MPADYTISTVNDLVDELNNAFDNDNTVSAWAALHLSTVP